MTRKPSPAEIEAKLKEVLSLTPLSLAHISDALYPFSLGNEEAIATVFEYMTEQMSDEEGEKYGLKGRSYTNVSPGEEEEDFFVTEDEEELSGNEEMAGYASPTLSPSPPPVSLPLPLPLPLPLSLPHQQSPPRPVALTQAALAQLNQEQPGRATPPVSGYEGSRVSSTEVAPEPTMSFLAEYAPASAWYQNNLRVPAQPSESEQSTLEDTVGGSMVGEEAKPEVSEQSTLEDTVGGSMGDEAKPEVDEESLLSNPGSILDHSSPSPPAPVVQIQSSSSLSSPGSILAHSSLSLQAPVPAPVAQAPITSPLSSPGSILDHSSLSPPPPPHPALVAQIQISSPLSSPGSILDHSSPAPPLALAPAKPELKNPSASSPLSSPGSTLNHSSPRPAPPVPTKRKRPANATAAAGEPGPKRARKTTTTTTAPAKKTARAGHVIVQCSGTTRKNARCGFTKQMPVGTQTWDCGRHR